ncbi:MAG: hypothetical protein J6W77_07480 [Prevotella sp.]|nr:hypothetical protein [Prevotella sp.]
MSCVCERCGTPFAYEVPEGYQEEVSRAKQSNSPSTPPPAYRNRQQQQRRVNMNRHSMNYEDEELYDEPQESMPNAPYGRQYSSSRRNGCLQRFYVIFLLTLIIFVFVIRRCYVDHSYNNESVGGKEMPKEVVTDDLSEAIHHEMHDVDEFEVVNPEEPPAWLQGNWSVETPEGPINVFIKGNRISESFDGKTERGTFYYSKGMIYCDFGNHEESIRKLDLSRERLEAGGGLWMEKNDF